MSENIGYKCVGCEKRKLYFYARVKDGQKVCSRSCSERYTQKRLDHMVVMEQPPFHLICQ